MTDVVSAARLTALRLVGFKSFAEKTLVEFGPGISAIVGPNGSGKSNLADALRWTLGEQGRMLRTRRAEDVIFAGSSSRKAISMADVTLVVDNQDGLLPVDFGEVEIGRRLYRSGENEYLLNKQRIRLRDLTELLDAGNLADNAFLFIGQGMVDQALALRPEERRPLFEEAAGVRRHERRRRQAETELAEAESNLERLRDVLGELRPQAKRLAAQAEQLQQRRTAGSDLAEALLAAARAKWIELAGAERREQKRLRETRAAADAALAELREAEERAAAVTAQMSTHADEERSRRVTLEKYRQSVVELRIALAGVDSELGALQREQAALRDERTAIEVRLRDLGLRVSVPPRHRDTALVAELESVDRSLAELIAASDTAAGAADAGRATARDLAALRGQHSQQQRRAQELTASLATARTRVEDLAVKATRSAGERDESLRRLEAVVRAETDAEARSETARGESTVAVAAVARAIERAANLEAELSGARARVVSLEATLEAATDESLARSARARGGTLVAEGLEVEPRFRHAVSVALDHASTGFLVADAAPLATGGRRGSLVVRPNVAQPGGSATTAAARVLSAASERGGGALTESIRRDPQGEVTRLLARVVWLPDIGAALAVLPSLPPGWKAVTLAGEAVTDEGVIRLASEGSVIERHAELDELRRRIADLETHAHRARSDVVTARETATQASSRASTAKAELDQARIDRRGAEEAERVAQRRAEQYARELNWEQAQVERMTADAQAASDLATQLAAEIRDHEQSAATGGDTSDARKAAADRIAALTARRDALVSKRAADEAQIAAFEDDRRRAEVRRAIDDSRLAELDAQTERMTSRQADLDARRRTLADSLAGAQALERQADDDLKRVLEAGAGDRTLLVEAERAAADARERLRVAESGSRSAEVAALEARLQLEQVRDGLLVELAAIGRDGLTVLFHATGQEPPDGDEESSAADAFEPALAGVLEQWQRTSADASEPPPSAARVAQLRRRFHDLGAGNPFAVEEYAELRDRLEGMEEQRADLESAIESTRELIASLTALISDQFTTTFAALEDAFGRRFHELFGGGDAQLSLTAPDDLSATGVEIHARPPGKKRQPLSMLSGGERALTAVSLLLAMLEVRPVPFCVLDEVDAALDEANVQRFSAALRGLAERTQFIVITHNRGTIEGADALYGVTIDDDAVSRVVSLRLPRARSNGSRPHGADEDTADDLVAQKALA